VEGEPEALWLALALVQTFFRRSGKRKADAIPVTPFSNAANGWGSLLAAVLTAGAYACPVVSGVALAVHDVANFAANVEGEPLAGGVSVALSSACFVVRVPDGADYLPVAAEVHVAFQITQRCA